MDCSDVSTRNAVLHRSRHAQCGRGSGCGECEDLVTAAYCGHDKCLRALLDKGAKVNAKGQPGLTALHASAISGKDKCLEILANHGASIDARSTAGLTTTHYAAKFAHDKCLQILIKHGADISMRGNDKWTALHFTVDKCKVDVNCFRTLIQNGADVNARRSDGWTVLHMVAWLGYAHLIPILVANKADINARDESGRTALYLAAKQGFDQCLQGLLKHGADVASKTKEGHTALQVAALNRSQACIQILLEHGADSKSHAAENLRVSDKSRRTRDSAKLLQPKFKRSRSLSFQGESSVSKTEMDISSKTVTNPGQELFPQNRCLKCSCVDCTHQQRKQDKFRKETEQLVSNLQTENTDLNRKVSTLETQTVEHNNERTNEIMQLKTENTELKRKHSSLETQCVLHQRETQNEMKRLKGANEELKGKNESLEARLCALEERECGLEGMPYIVLGMERLGCGDMLSKEYARSDVKAIFTPTNFNTFCERLQPSPTIEHMWAKGVFSQRTYEDIRSLPTDMRKAERLWVLMKRREKHLRAVRDALLATGQQHLAPLLQ